MGETVIEAVVEAVGTTGADIILIAAAIIVAVQLAMLAYRYVGRLVGVSQHKIAFGGDDLDSAPLSGEDPDEARRGQHSWMDDHEWMDRFRK